MPVAGVKRDAQRRRTRQAVITAAADLLAQGKTPSMAEVADAAEVSRRTVYLYFSSLDHLLADAALEAARPLVEPHLLETDDVEQRLESLVRAVQGNATASEDLGRIIIRHTIEPRPESDGEAVPRRGYRRVAWIEQALEPARERLGEDRFEALVSQLTLVLGWEALIILRDTRGLSAEEAVEVSVAAALAMLRAALGGSPGR
jgi:AcrR family transcriptional regulator